MKDEKLIIPQPKVRKIGVRPSCTHKSNKQYTRKIKHKKSYE